jgi:PDZ domain-containing protein
MKVDRSDVKTYPANGNMYLLTIWVSTPDAKVLGAEILTCWARPDCVVFPRSVIYKKSTDSKSEEKQSQKEMKVSQSVALTAAKRLITRKFPTVDTTKLTDSSFKVSLPDTGGPSGGLIFSLGLVELLTPEDLLQGRKIAGSGTISPDGRVGAIGGIAEKIIAAKKAGASILFASKENCDEIPQKVSGIRVIAISNLDQAVAYLLQREKGDSSGVYGCTNLGT